MSTSTTLTIESINAMTTPKLRAAVKEKGGDPKTMGNSDPEQMKKWLIEQLGLNKPAKPAAKPTAKAAAAPAKGATPAAPKPPVKTDEKPAAKPDAKAAPAAKPTEKPTQSFADEVYKLGFDAEGFKNLKYVLMRLEKRVQVIEDGTGLKEGVKNPYACIQQFIKDKEDGSGQKLAISPEQLQALSEEQLDAVYLSVNKKKFPEGLEVREKRDQVAAMFKTAPASTSTKKGATPVAKAPPPATEITPYEVGDVVSAKYDGKDWDPCKILKVNENEKRGKKTYTYTVFFNEDGTWVDNFPHSEIIGKSENEMTEDETEYGWEG